MKDFKKRSELNIPELLAPAGSKEAFIAAVEAGADAIYIGGHEFNARMSATNFSVEEIREACDFAHKRGVKVHVTINTLIENDELEAALKYAEELWEIGVDALIVQDLGLASLIHKCMPDFSMHMSTQGTIYNADGVRVCEEMGFSRVVLARELTLKEIEAICKETNLEIEVFCHGALCYCYSGQCQMSRALGGRSANRGACAQPCRMSYLDNGYALSPKDLDVLDYLPELAAAGVSSLKIEGRMKSPEYVAAVTSIYRKYLDKLKTKEAWQIDSADRVTLAQVFSRGFTDATLSGEEDSKLMSLDSPKNKGISIGRTAGSKLIKEGRYYLDLEIDGAQAEGAMLDGLLELAKGDVLEVQGDPGSSFAVTYLERMGPGKYRVGDAKDEYALGYRVNRVISSKLMSAYSRYYKNKDWHEGKFTRKKTVEAHVTVGRTGEVALALKDPETGVSVKKSSGPYAVSEVSGSMEGRVRSSLAKTGGTPFDIRDVKFHGNAELDIPVKEINELRRQVVSELEDAFCVRREGLGLSLAVKDGMIAVGAYGSVGDQCEAQGREDAQGEVQGREDAQGEAQGHWGSQGAVPSFEIYAYDVCAESLVEAMKICESEGVEPTILFPAAKVDEVMELKGNLQELQGADFVPYINSVSKGLEERLVLEKIETLGEFCLSGEVPIYIGNISHLHLLSDLVDKGVGLRYDYGVNVYNEACSQVMESMGVMRGAPSLETIGYHMGPYPLMIIQHRPVAEALENSKGRRFKLIKTDYSEQAKLVDVTDFDFERGLRETIAIYKESGESRRYYII